MKGAEFDIAIIGGGCIGSSILLELTRLGIGNVALLDAGRSTVSASANSGGMLRVFHEDARHMDLALANYRLIKDYEAMGILGRNPAPNGSLYFFRKERLDGYQAGLQRMIAADYPFELVTGAQGSERFPDFVWKDDECAVYEPAGQHRDPRTFVEELLSACRRQQVKIHDDFDVQRICPYLDQYRICGPSGTITAKSLVLAGGARLLPRLRELGLAFDLEAKTLTTYGAEKTVADHVRPNYFDRETLEFGRLGPGPQVILSQTHPTRLVRPHWQPRFKATQAADCYAPQRIGILGQIPGHSRLVLVTGWGGTAFKFSLAIGRLAGEVIERGFFGRRSQYA